MLFLNGLDRYKERGLIGLDISYEVLVNAQLLVDFLGAITSISQMSDPIEHNMQG